MTILPSDLQKFSPDLVEAEIEVSIRVKVGGKRKAGITGKFRNIREAVTGITRALHDLRPEMGGAE